MHMIKKQKNFLVLSLVLTFLSGCAGSITVHNFTACAIAPGHTGVVCDDFLDNHQVVLDEQEWSALQPGWIAISSEAFGDLKVEIEDTCNQLNCSYDQKVTIQDFFKRVDALKR